MSTLTERTGSDAAALGAREMTLMVLRRELEQELEAIRVQHAEARVRAIEAFWARASDRLAALPVTADGVLAGSALRHRRAARAIWDELRLTAVLLLAAQDRARTASVAALDAHQVAREPFAFGGAR